MTFGLEQTGESFLLPSPPPYPFDYAPDIWWQNQKNRFSIWLIKLVLVSLNVQHGTAQNILSLVEAYCGAFGTILLRFSENLIIAEIYEFFVASNLL